MFEILKILGVSTVLTPTVCDAIKLPRWTPIPPMTDEMSIKKIIEGLGMVYESYAVETEDGYILNLNRMVNPNLRNTKDKGVPVLLVNGLAMWSDAWFVQPIPILNPRKDTVAWLLRGYDIWLGDQRGSGRSRKHKTMSPQQWKFWDFSFHEMGVYDLPAFIDIILRKTPHEKVAFSGISNSAAYFYTLCTERPDYQEKLYGGILLAPVGESPQLSTMKLAERLNIYDAGLFMSALWTLGVGAYPEHVLSAKRNYYTACRMMTPVVSIGICSLVMGSGCKFHTNLFCSQTATAFGGTSTKTMIHTTQLYSNGGKFTKYDYGFARNLQKYGQTNPPEYNVSRVTAFTAVYYSDTDVWAPARVIEPFLMKFQGPKYECMTHGVCHVFHLLDSRAGPFIKDATNVLDSMTGRTNSTELYSKCKIKL